VQLQLQYTPVSCSHCREGGHTSGLAWHWHQL
jgi:hypothetical protein